jgi:hypothetical protein
MKNRDNYIGRSMPRKSRHGTKIARWGTHDEMKDRKMRPTWSKRDIPIID